ncbi:hypothetical protein QJS10_CPB15g01377 [Acorus calamus]|uniref:Uncharacterized protein n=1 Tax=Acorus calamus TaxID=4465 RepID=A0AAV9DB25_ACOCL|nr:hypothetical protein QJS10_CPB15g01377 [Acorus calamus]
MEEGKVEGTEKLEGEGKADEVGVEEGSRVGKGKVEGVEVEDTKEEVAMGHFSPLLLSEEDGKYYGNEFTGLFRQMLKRS